MYVVAHVLHTACQNECVSISRYKHQGAIWKAELYRLVDVIYSPSLTTPQDAYKNPEVSVAISVALLKGLCFYCIVVVMLLILKNNFGLVWLYSYGIR